MHSRLSKIMDMGRFWYRHLVYPLLDLRRGTKSQKLFSELTKSQWLKPEEIERIQKKRLRALIIHSYENVPFYNKVFKGLALKPDDIKYKEDLKKLPLINKDIIRANFEDFKARNFKSHKPIERTTGGTTGEPLKYYSDKIEHSVFWADLWRAWSWAGWDIGDRRATIGGSRPAGSGFRSFVRSRFMERNLSLSSFEVNYEAMQIHVEKLRKFRPKILRGYPSSLYLFTKYMNESKVRNIGVGSVITISEQVYPHQRKAIKQAFGCEVYDNYGCPDGGVVACECEEHEYHLNSENAIVEIVKGNEVSAAGEEGEMVSTNLVRYAMPFIRYRTGDMGKVSGTKPNCKRGLEILDSILGRTNDYILLPSGNLLAAVNIASVFNEISSQIHIRQYQVVQEKRDELLILVVEDEGFSEKDSEIISNSLKEHIAEEMEITVKQVDDIPLTVSGKRRSVISKLKVGFD
jgi:phenylacetate-CoA ligase